MYFLSLIARSHGNSADELIELSMQPSFTNHFCGSQAICCKEHLPYEA